MLSCKVQAVNSTLSTELLDAVNPRIDTVNNRNILWSKYTQKVAFDSCHVEVVARSDDINLTSYKSAFSPAAISAITPGPKKD
jgi:hypothetical protein